MGFVAVWDAFCHRKQLVALAFRVKNTLAGFRLGLCHLVGDVHAANKRIDERAVYLIDLFADFGEFHLLFRFGIDELVEAAVFEYRVEYGESAGSFGDGYSSGDDAGIMPAFYHELSVGLLIKVNGELRLAD